MFIKNIIRTIACLFVIFQCQLCLAADVEPIGWATLGGGTTGGLGGEVVTVTTKSEFQSAVSGDTPRIIQVVGTIHGDYNIPNVGSNKTILGIGYDARIVGFSVKVTDLDNVIVRNITFNGAMPQDGLICRRATHLWIDHCTFYDASDGLCDFSDQCDYVTVSWCKFYYTGKVNRHRLSCLVGSTDDNLPDVGKLNMTFHHNWWGSNCDQRMPRVRYGQNHVYNNYYSCTGNYYCIGGSWGAKVLLENNYFDHVNNPMLDAGRTDTGDSGTFRMEIKSVDNIFDGCTGSKTTYGTAFVPGYTYSLDEAANVPSIVMAGAGTTILVGDPSLWPVKASVPTPINGDGNAEIGSMLTWRAGSTAVSHDVYFGTSPTNLGRYDRQVGTSFVAPALEANTIYYWRIDEVTSDDSVITGDVWAFRTTFDFPSEVYHYWPFDVDFLDAAKVFEDNPNNPFGAAWLDSNAKLLGGGCLDCTYAKDGLIVGWSETSTNKILPSSAPMTISLWFRTAALPASDKTGCMFGCKTGSVSSAKTFRIEQLPTGACRLTVDSELPEFGNIPTLNSWNHVLVSIDASGQLRAWLNADEAGSITLATNASNNYNGQYIGIGFYGDTANGLHRGDYDGYIDDFTIWSRATDRAFAEAIYNGGSGKTVIGPVFTGGPIESEHDAVELSSYSGLSLDNFAYDLDGIATLTYSKDNGPSWLAVHSDGRLSGIPGDTNVGSNEFTVRVTDEDGLFGTAKLIVDVSNLFSGIQGVTDLSGLAAQWLAAGCVDIPACGGASLDGNTEVNLSDISVMSQNWLVDDTLQLHLKFDESSGDTVDDSSIYDRSCRLINTPAWSSGYVGNGLNFDGIDDYVLVDEYYGIGCANARTVAVWIKAEADLDNIDKNFRTIASWGKAAVGQKWVILLDADTGKLTLSIWGAELIGGPDLEDGQWHHVAVVLPEGVGNIKDVKMYVDGIEIETNAETLNAGIRTAATESVMIGAFDIDGAEGVQNTIFFFKGDMDEFMVFDGALTAQEIAELN